MIIELKDIVYFVAGLAGGFGINHFFFKKQSKADERAERNLYVELDRHYEQALRNGVRDAEILEVIRRMQAEVAPLFDLVEIKAQMEQVMQSMESVNSEQKIPQDLVFRYKALGDRWSELASVQLELKVLDSKGQVDLDRFKIAHRSIFPDNYPWAGELRREHVYIADTLGTIARIVDLAEAETKISTIPPDRIDSNLQRLFNHWNEGVDRLQGREPQTKISEVAHFHHELEMIHPFLDGNGRIGRMILEEQLAFLFGSQITFRPERNDYYRALRALDMGSSELLVGLIETELKKFSVPL